MSSPDRDDLTRQDNADKAEYIKKITAKAQTQIDRLKNQIEDLIEKKNDVSDDKYKFNVWHNQTKQKHFVVGALEELKKRINPFSTLPIKKELDDSLELLKQLHEKKKHFHKKQELFNIIAYHLGHNGIQSYLLENMSDRLVSLIGTIADDPNLRVIHSDKEKLVKKYNGYDMSLMSGGELQRLKIASFLAYRHILSEVMQWSSNLLIFDEPDTYVDASGVKYMMEMIHKESKDKCIIVISHTNSMHRDMALFENHVVIERDDKGSRKRKRL